MTVTDEEILDEYEYRPFDQIEARLHTTREHLLEAPRDVVATALHLSTINSVASLSTHVEAHERATVAVWEVIGDGVPSEGELAEAMDARSPDGSKAVMYYNNKAQYVRENLLNVDFDALAKLYQEERWFELQGEIARQVKGVQNVKAAFSLANLGVVECCCMDRIMHTAFDVYERFDAKDPFGTVVVDRYYNRVDELRAETPKSAEKLSRYMWQWAAWSAARDDGFTLHDPWFMLLDDLLEADVFVGGQLPSNSQQLSEITQQ